MARRRDFYMTDQAEADLEALVERWGLSMSATVARALREAAKRKA